MSISLAAAHAIAVVAHEGQTDKLGVPYIKHCKC
jgi:(p)ppGpp synthase/HD superfamily hydrolase